MFGDLMVNDVKEIVENISKKFNIIGRKKELEAILLAKKADRPVLIEGPVGVGKTTLAKAVAQYFQQNFIRIDGDERFDEYKLVGYFEPQLVLKMGWTWDSFFPGPLVKAMLDGAILFINEINRLNEGAQNVLIPALDEKIVEIPKLGEIRAKDGFWVIATLNPEEYVGVTPLGEALRDRFIWVRLDYQSEEEEIEIVKLHAGVNEEVARLTVAISRATRRHPEIRRGSSVRGAIDLALLIKMHGPNYSFDDVIDLSIKALGTKIELTEGTNRDIEDIIRDIVEELLSNSDFFHSKRQIKVRFSENLQPSKTHLDQVPSENNHDYSFNSLSKVLPDPIEEKKNQIISNRFKDQQAVLIFYPQEDMLMNIFRGMLGYFGLTIITSIREGKNIKDILSRLWRPLDYESIYLLGLEAIKYRNLAALTALAEMSPYAVAHILEEYLSDVELEDNLFLVNLYYLTKSYLTPRKRRIFQKLAKRIIMHKAVRLIGRKPFRSGKIRKRVSYRPSLDFDLELTLENTLGKTSLEAVDKKDIVCIERHDKRTAGAIILDISGSMFGEKNVLASVISAMAIYSMSLEDDFSIILFADYPMVIKGMREKKNIDQLIEEIFNIRPIGYTNISAALREALVELQKTKIKTKKWAILITDGEYNRGENPLKWASRFKKLHVIQLGGGSRGTQICKLLAKDKGKYIRVASSEELLIAIRNILRYPDK